MRVVLLGCGGWFTSDERRTCSVLVQTAGAQFVFDAGSGFPRLRDFLDAKKPLFLFLSHYHVDHVSGLFSDFALGGRAPAITVVGQPGVENDVMNFFNQPYSPFKPTNLSFEELRAGTSKKFADGRVSAERLVHTSPCIGFKLEVNRKSLAYVTDTQYCSSSVKLSRKTDLVLHDSTYLEAERPHLPPNLAGHSTSLEAAAAAKKGEAKKLVLFHLNVYHKKKQLTKLLAGAKRVFPSTVLAKDLMEFRL